jgi:hypothetical protein
LEIVAQIEDGEDADAVRRDLQSKVECEIEQHVMELKDGIQDLQAMTTTRERIKRLEYELESKTKELDELKGEFEDRPLFAPKK